MFIINLVWLTGGPWGFYPVQKIILGGIILLSPLLLLPLLVDRLAAPLSRGAGSDLARRLAIFALKSNETAALKSVCSTVLFHPGDGAKRLLCPHRRRHVHLLVGFLGSGAIWPPSRRYSASSSSCSAEWAIIMASSCLSWARSSVQESEGARGELGDGLRHSMMATIALGLAAVRTRCETEAAVRPKASADPRETAFEA